MPGTVTIVEYDPLWPILFEGERHCVLEAVGGKVLALEHVGSTAVPGLGGKPIIDMMAGVLGIADAEECVRLVERLGYTDVTPQPGNQEWFYCLGRGHHSEAYHLHLVKFMSGHWGRQLLFRDFLRAHPDVAQQYYELKKKLAADYGSDRMGYTEAKTSFIESVLDMTHRQKMPIE